MRWCSLYAILAQVMNKQQCVLLPMYAAVLRRYLAQPREALRQEAYELGRAALGLELGVLDVVRIHQEALTWRQLPSPAAKVNARELKAAETFLVESLSPFEAAHRGFRRAHLALRRLNGALQRRNAELVAMNHALEKEVKERQRVEQALRESGDHYRQLFHQASLMQERLRSLSNQVLHAQEEERRRISRELHDEIGAVLTAIGTSLAMLPGNGSVNAELLRQRMAKTQMLLEQTMHTVHHFARELRPSMLDELGLVPALRSYLKAFAERTGTHARLNGSAGAEELDDERKTVLFRVTQESLTNVAKHAAASRVTVTFRRLGNAVRLQIKDNGKGFEAERPLGANGARRLGLLGMAERLRLVDGHLTVTSAPGKGTTVSADLPYTVAGNPPPRATISSVPHQAGRLLAERTTPPRPSARP